MRVTVEQMASTLRRRAAARAARASSRAEALLAHMPEARNLLRARYGATSVWLFGSLAVGNYRDTSDVDIAVTGLASVDYFAALTDLMNLFAVPVDLVRLEEASSSLKERILAEGRRL
ncbi:MAG: nucleotidyltransferase domain-containing protein [Vicinamibacterales bacterium]